MAKGSSFLGIDLSPDSIKLVELTSERGKPQLVTYGYTESKSDVLKGDFVINKNITSTLIKEVADQAKVTSNVALAALPVSAVFTSVIKLSNLLKKETENKPKIKAMIADELKKIAPRPLDELAFDFNLIPTEEVESAGRNDKLSAVKFLITAAPNDVVKNYVEIFKQAGFQLASLDIESFAYVRSLVGKDKALILVVDIGENRTSLSIINLAMPLLNRSIQVGSSIVTRAIADSLNITISEAENYKLDLGIMMAQEKMDNFPRPIEDAVAPIVTEIKYLLKTYYDQLGKGEMLDKIIITGGGSLLGSFLDKYLTKVLGINTYVGDPWARVVYPEELKPILQEIGPRFTVALGLAMRELI